MITWVTVWFMVFSSHGDQFRSESYAIPYATKEICLKQAKKVNDRYGNFERAKCVFGQMPVRGADK